MCDKSNNMPTMVARYAASGVRIPERYWDEVQAGVPWAEILDAMPVYDTTPARPNRFRGIATHVRGLARFGRA